MPNRRRFRVPNADVIVAERAFETDELPRLVECKTQSPRDREMREQLHKYRYLMFQHGVTVREIAESESVDERQIYLSISHSPRERIPRRLSPGWKTRRRLEHCDQLPFVCKLDDGSGNGHCPAPV